LHHCARHGDTLDCQQVIKRKMQPDAEHQQHDADLRKLGGQLHIGHEARRTGSDDDAGHQVAHQCRHPDPLGQKTEDQGDAEASGERGDE
jgi:hypothetical protein